MESLTDLLVRHGHTDKHTKHTYNRLYEEWFAPFRHRPVNFLAVGTESYGGGDLLTFADYFASGTIYSLDHIDERFLPAVREHPRIKLITADAYANSTPALFDGIDFDIIVDDCVHNHQSQVRLANLFFGKLKPGGLYVIEDVPQVHLPLFKPMTLAGRVVTPVVYDLSAERPKRGNNILIRLA